MLKEKFFDLFHKNYEPEPNTGCWLWTGNTVKSRGGYGRLGKKGHRAHKVSWLLTHGIWPSRDQVVMHKCDTPACVNPDHLKLGTFAENAADMVAKNRSAKCKGEKHSQNKLSDQDILNMRVLYKEGMTQAELHRYYSVSRATICNILNGNSWTHI